ncbi:MAG TPA: acyl-CoA thioesterase [Burkholderiaceae bacterium]|nr:acyl-CoA thioesterase [Burkholderiaceae bacterium]
MTFTKPYLIRLAHCDPTGMVFLPNYFYVFNALVEDWFYEGLEVRYDEYLMQRRLALSTVKLETVFSAPTQMGENVEFWLTVTHLGRSSIRFTMGVDHEGNSRVRMHRIAVLTSQADHRPVPWPQELREKINEFMLG